MIYEQYISSSNNVYPLYESDFIKHYLYLLQKKFQKLVYMGRLNEKESFGEISVLLQVSFTCTIVTGKDVEMAIIEDKDLHGKYINAFYFNYSAILFHKFLIRVVVFYRQIRILRSVWVFVCYLQRKHTYI